MAIIEKIHLLRSDLPKYVLSGPLTAVTTYTIHVTGPWGSREVRNLIRMLTLQAEWLEEDEPASSLTETAAGLEAPGTAETPSPESPR